MGKVSKLKLRKKVICSSCDGYVIVGVLKCNTISIFRFPSKLLLHLLFMYFILHGLIIPSKQIIYPTNHQLTK